MSDPISEDSIRDLIERLDRLIRVSESTASLAARSGGDSGRGPGVVGRTVSDAIDDYLQKVFGGRLKKAQDKAEKQAREQAVLGETTAETQERVNKAVASSSRIWQQAGKNSRFFADSLIETTDALKKMSSKLLAGATTAGEYTKGASAVIKGLTGTTLALAKVNPALAIAAYGVVKFATALTEAQVEQADAQFAAYKELQKFGGATADGVMDVHRMSQALNIGQQELQKLTSLIAENGQGLAVFRGSVADGARDLANISEDLTDRGFRDKFLRMGITIDEQNESTAYYIRLQSRLGLAQNKSVSELARGVAEYVQEQDKLTKLTGMTRKEQENARDAAMADEMMRVRREEARRSGDAKAIKEADEAFKVYERLKAIDPTGQMSTAFSGLQNGFIATQAAQDAFVLSTGEAQRVAMDSSLSVAERTQQFAESIGRGTDDIGSGLARVGQFAERFTTFTYSAIKDAEVAAADLPNRLRQIDAETRDQGDPERLDRVTKGMAAIEAAGINIRKSMEDLNQLAIKPVIIVLDKLAGAVDWTADAVNSAAQRITNQAGTTSRPPRPYATGGIATGPTSGYPATLHGTEAVVPLPDGKTIPVSIQGGIGSGAGLDPETAARANEELQSFAQIVSRLGRDFGRVVVMDADELSSGAVFGRDDQRLTLEEKSVTTLTQIKDLLSESLGIEVPTWQFGGGGAGFRGGASGGFGGGGGFASGGAPAAPGMGGGSGVTAPRAPAAPGMGGGSGVQVNQQQLASEYGLTLRPSGGDIQKEGAELNPKLIELAQKIQETVPGFAWFTGLNDRFHQEKAPNSRHTKGLALDFVLDPKTASQVAANPEFGQDIAKHIRSLGANFVLDEYNQPSARRVGRGHFHAEVPEARTGGILKGPPSGFPATLHGTEAVVPLPDGRTIPVQIPGMDSFTSIMDSLPNLLSGSLSSLMSPVIKSISSIAAPNLPMMSGPNDIMSMLMNTINNPQGAAGNIGGEGNVGQVLSQLTETMRNSQTTDRGANDLLQQLVNLQRDQNASLVRLIQASTA